MQNQKNIYFVGAAAIVAALIIGFSVGRHSRRAGNLRFTRANLPIMGANWPGPMARHGMFPSRSGWADGNLSGQIVSISSNQITVKLFDGNTQKVLLSDTTTYTQIDQANQSNLKEGGNISIVANANRTVLSAPKASESA